MHGGVEREQRFPMSGQDTDAQLAERERDPSPLTQDRGRDGEERKINQTKLETSLPVQCIVSSWPTLQSAQSSSYPRTAQEGILPPKVSATKRQASTNRLVGGGERRRKHSIQVSFLFLRLRLRLLKRKNNPARRPKHFQKKCA